MNRSTTRTPGPLPSPDATASPRSRPAAGSRPEPATAAAVTLRLPAALRADGGDPAHVRIEAASVADLLAELARLHPALHRAICDETGAVRRHLNLFVNTTHIRDRDGLGTRLAPGDEVILLPAVSGG